MIIRRSLVLFSKTQTVEKVVVLYNRALHATNFNGDACANIVAVYTDCHCIVQSVQYQLRFLDK